MADEFSLDEYGRRVWRHKTDRNQFVERSYHWVDRVVVLDETEGRRITHSGPYSTFDFKDWIPVTVEEFSRVKQKFNEIYTDTTPV